MNIQEIKFSGERVDNGEIVEGYLVKQFNPRKNKHIYFIYTGNAEFEIDSYYTEEYEVVPSTIRFECDYIENIERELIDKNNKIAELLNENKLLKEDVIKMVTIQQHTED